MKVTINPPIELPLPFWEVIHDGCVELLNDMGEEVVDAIVTDPPYELAFMNKRWDSSGVSFNVVPWKACLRVLKPGGYLLSFGGTRTYHRMACAIEDAGFEIRDCIAWMYGSGFPKSHDVSKAIDKVAGAKCKVIGLNPKFAQQTGQRGTVALNDRIENPSHYYLHAPATPEAKQWQGWGTALKPAFEPIVVARKPFKGTVAKNVLTHGTGAINIDGCRIEGKVPSTIQGQSSSQQNGDMYSGRDQRQLTQFVGHASGRWPANVILDEQAAEMLDEQTGELHSQNPATRAHPGAAKFTNQGAGDNWLTQRGADGWYGDSGGASRFFYVAKANKKERNAGLTNPNRHPTVKPIKLMRYLCRLVTPPQGLIVDPFMGSGSTGIAAILEDFDFIGIDSDAYAVNVARKRIAYWGNTL